MRVKRRPSDKRVGFTIIELLMVVVVIAILATITLSTYNGVQQRATNAAIIDAVSKSLRMIQSYVAANDAYPYVFTGASGWLCITSSSGCEWAEGSVISTPALYVTNMATMGSMPLSVPVSNTNRYGIIYYWKNDWVLANGTPRPIALIYWLQGLSQQCGVQGVFVESGSTVVPTTTGYSGNDTVNGKTQCYASVPGPAG